MHAFARTLRKHKNLWSPGTIIRLAVAVLVAAAPLTVWVRAAQAQSDSTAPVLSSLVADTTTVEADTAPGQVVISGFAQDDMSGFHGIESYFTSPSGNLVYTGDLGITGVPDENGWTSISITVNFPQHTEPGIWRPNMTVYDETGNFVVLTADDLVAAGYNLDITVVSNSPDTTAPTLTGLSWNMPNVIVDNTTNYTQIVASVDAYDYNQALHSLDATLQLVSPSGSHSVHGIAAKGPGVPGTFTAGLDVPAYSEGGEWLLYLTLCDGIGNCHLYEPAELESLFLPSSIMVVSEVTDNTPVNISLLDITAGDPIFDTILPGGAAISARVEFSDDLSGAQRIFLQYRSQTSNQVSHELGLVGGQDNVSYYLNTTLPAYAAEGLWLPEVYTLDIAGNEKVYTHTDLLGLGFDLSFTLGSSVVETVPADQTVSSDTGNDGATATDPIEASVTTPTGGSVSVTKVDLTQDAVTTPGYSLAGQQISISAPSATPEEPMTLTFVLDASHIPEGQNAQTVTIFRNTAAIAPCQDNAVAIPDPCVLTRATLADGDIELTVHTSAASVWVMGFPDSTQTLFQGFKNPVKDAPKVNKVEAGEVVPVKFWFGNNADPNVLPEANITSQEIDCSTKQSVGPATEASVNGNGVKANGTVTKFNWKTLKKWKNSCRQLNLTFTNGEVAHAYFTFKD